MLKLIQNNNNKNKEVKSNNFCSPKVYRRVITKWREILKKKIIALQLFCILKAPVILFVTISRYSYFLERMVHSMISESTGTPLHLMFLTNDESKVIFYTIPAHIF